MEEEEEEEVGGGWCLQENRNDKQSKGGFGSGAGDFREEGGKEKKQGVDREKKKVWSETKVCGCHLQVETSEDTQTTESGEQWRRGEGKKQIVPRAFFFFF